MALYFCDSSAILKRYRRERGSDWVERLCSSESIAVSTLIIVEVNSALARLVHQRFVDRSDHTTMVQRFSDDCQTFDFVEVDRPMIETSSELFLQLPGNVWLRSLDAIQLACAIGAFERVRDVGLSPGAFVSADLRLLAAAAWAGLPVENPDDHP